MGSIFYYAASLCCNQFCAVYSFYNENSASSGPWLAAGSLARQGLLFVLQRRSLWQVQDGKSCLLSCCS